MVTLTKMGRLALNKTAAVVLANKGAEFAELMWDKDNNRVGVKIVPKGKGVYTLMYGDNSNGVGFSCTTFLNFIRYDWTVTRNFSIQWHPKEGMYVFDISEAYIGNPPPPGYKSGRTGQLMRADRVRKPNENLDIQEEIFKSQEPTEIGS